MEQEDRQQQQHRIDDPAHPTGQVGMRRGKEGRPAWTEAEIEAVPSSPDTGALQKVLNHSGTFHAQSPELRGRSMILLVMMKTLPSHLGVGPDERTRLG